MFANRARDLTTNDAESTINDSGATERDNSGRDHLQRCPERDPEEQAARIAVLHALELTSQMNGSIKDFLDLLNFGKGLHSKGNSKLKTYWPKDWKETKELLKDVGYKEPRVYYICLDASHVNRYDIMDKSDQKCRHCGKVGKTKYYYLSLRNKIEKWCANKDMCEKMTAHWREKDHWFYSQEPYYPLKEVWDGTRFAELSYFFDKEKETLVPVKCTFCTSVIPATEICCGLDVGEDKVEVQCDDCGTLQTCQKTFVKGDPRNITLMGHWDGWLPFQGSKHHGCGSYS